MTNERAHRVQDAGQLQEIVGPATEGVEVHAGGGMIRTVPDLETIVQPAPEGLQVHSGGGM